MPARLVHSEPLAWLPSQNWFAKHTSSPHVHASLFSADAFAVAHAFGTGTVATWKSTESRLNGDQNTLKQTKDDY